MKKVGIITHYYNSVNYGGVLQSYALCRVINQFGFDCEQISFEMKFADEIPNKKRRSLKSFLRKIKGGVLSSFFKNKWELRKKAFENFRGGSIPHTQEVYDEENIQSCDGKYDVYVTGSDQVWNIDWYQSAYFLKFVTKGKKIAYAASLGKNQLNESQKQLFKDIQTFDAISVREQNAVQLLSAIVPCNIEWVLDPTLLLSKQEWDEICAKREIQDRYLFCYFLGTDLMPRKLAVEFAKKHKLKIVSLPHFPYYYKKCDAKFGDVQLYSVSPEEFISLIKNAEYVFTDSFHASAFSCLYQKQFFSFGRAGASGMNGRLETLMQLFDCVDHFCGDEQKQKIEYIAELPQIDYGEKAIANFQKAKEYSLNFLRISLE